MASRSRSERGPIIVIQEVHPSHIERLDHLVLTITDIPATCTFYIRILGMQGVAVGDGRKALAFGDQNINLHQVGHEFEPKALRRLPGWAATAHSCTRDKPATMVYDREGHMPQHICTL